MRNWNSRMPQPLRKPPIHGRNRRITAGSRVAYDELVALAISLRIFSRLASRAFSSSHSSDGVGLHTIKIW